MHFDTWEPVYEAILDDFGYDRVGDERARDELAELVARFDESRLEFLDGATVAIAGAGPSLRDSITTTSEADVVVAASTAVDVLQEEGVDVDVMVTDLDKNAATARELTRAGTPVVVHAHGDNRSLLAEAVPTFDTEFVLATTQAAPVGPVSNFGGFTDGDRAAFLADHFGAAELTFAGWDFEDPSVSPEKAKKLTWAERLLYWLERRRNDSFTVLDGRRNRIDTSALPFE